ncbi:MAG TPA: GNAT family N-acetyltransferase [Lacisediminihabitans sp.]|uniref:GNAT family N-acetyltransferase n=1 Tax=Lacisediminihabitans sp. TaxID=2787631 RepID=UPI002EDB6A1D
MPSSISTTARLLLAPLNQADIDDVFRLYSDPATWRHLPSGRHTDRTQSLKLVERTMASRADHGLGQWSVRLRESVDGLSAGSFLGVGGVTMTAGDVWNLGYRFTPPSWGHGFATELSTAAIAAARQRHPDRPVTARVLSTNPASAAVARRVGLTLVWEGQRSAGDGAGRTGQIYSDRPLSGPSLDWLIENL